jgi:hypothetical protein
MMSLFFPKKQKKNFFEIKKMLGGFYQKGWGRGYFKDEQMGFLEMY